MLFRRPSLLRPQFRSRNVRRGFSSVVEPKASDGLRVLFCGSDQFSCVSLKALHHEHCNGELIKSIDVMVRPGKPTGRGLKTMREVPLAGLARGLGLNLHERDTFTGWDLPRPGGEPINLIVAVSFGLFVPPRILSSAKYGGLNVHPSLLPDLRGPAPLQHALLGRRTHTGVTLQTLSGETFDAGTVLAQTARPGIPIPEACTVPQLHDLLAPMGAEMLVDGLRRGLHVPPHVHVGWVPTEEEARHVMYAPKITPACREVRWTLGARSQDDSPVPWTASDMELRNRTLGPLWTHTILPRDLTGGPKGTHSGYPCIRVMFEDVEEVAREDHGYDLFRDAQAAEFSSIHGQNSSGQHRELHRTVWVQKTRPPAFRDGTSSKEEDTDALGVTLLRRPYVIQDESIIMPVSPDGHHGLVRIGGIKVEGERLKPAALAIQPFTLPNYSPSADWPVGDQNKRNRFPLAEEPAKTYTGFN